MSSNRWENDEHIYEQLDSLKTSPSTIKVVADTYKDKPSKGVSTIDGTYICSSTQLVKLDKGVICGERLNFFETGFWSTNAKQITVKTIILKNLVKMLQNTLLQQLLKARVI